MSAFAVLVGLALPAIAWEKSEAGVKQNPLKDAYFGETHLHTGVSMDAFIGGVFALAWAFRRLEIRLPEWTRAIPPHAIGSLAMFWAIQRSWDYTFGRLL